MTEKEKMIPLSVIDAAIEKLEIDNNYCYECGIDYQNYARTILEEIKKEAIPFEKIKADITDSWKVYYLDSNKQEQPLEQKIKARIKHLDEGYPSDIKWSTANMIDELRKLVTDAV